MLQPLYVYNLRKIRFMIFSADADVGIKIEIPLDHREICKPAGRDCFLYLELVKLIENIFSQRETQ